MRNVKLYAKITALAGSVLLMFTGCGESHKVVDSSDTTTSVTNTTDDPITTTTYGDTSVIEADGTTAYYVTDEVGETSFIDATDFISTLGDTTSKTRETTSVSGGDTTSKVTGDTTSKSDIETTIGTNVTTSKSNTSKTTGTTARTTSKTTSTTKVSSSRNIAAATTAKTTTTPKVTTTTVKTTTTPKVTTTTTVATTNQTDLYNYTFNDISNNVWAFRNYSSDFRFELMYKPDSFGYMLYLSYGLTNGGYERNLIFAALNDGYISNDILNQVFSELTPDQLEDSKEFFYKFGYVQQQTGNKIDFTKYTINKDLGNYLNKIQNAYFDGTFDQFMTDQIINGNIPQEYLNNVAVMTLISSYDDYGKYVTQYEVETGCMANFMDKIYNAAYGHSYTK